MNEENDVEISEKGKKRKHIKPEANVVITLKCRKRKEEKNTDHNFQETTTTIIIISQNESFHEA